MVTAVPDYFLGCDWGTSTLRLRLLRSEDASIVSELKTDVGVAKIAGGAPLETRAEAFRAELAKAVEDLGRRTTFPSVRLPVIVSGMASASIGWKELPYASLPFTLKGSSAVLELIEGELSKKIGPVWLCSGVRDDADVMRGEETEVLGIAALTPNLFREPATLVLPGTHSKHLTVQDGAVVSFRTYMTGELYDVMSTASILRHSVAGATGAPRAEAFAEGVALAQREHPFHLLFRVRAMQLLQGREPEESAEFLSGLLIGSELRDCRTRVGEGHQVLLYAPGPLGERYRTAGALLNWSELRLLSFSLPPVVYGQRALLDQVKEMC
ncbi:MAG: 2-dehydro-3-deoxygalactonokinase [Bdellovibrionales bacterium]|nr:2-dehydro-3-deoxygalactonokinase [Bdellovibrionales bacterium]